MDLKAAFLALHRRIEQRLSGFELDFSHVDSLRPRPFELTAPASSLLQTAMGLSDDNFSSWMPGMPIAALLASGRRIMVDLAPAFLVSYRRNYGIPEDALIAFAQAGMLLFNIRDFDPTASDDAQHAMAASYRKWEPFLTTIFERAPDSVYFLAGLRPRIFDPIPGIGMPAGYTKPGLAEIFDIAERDLQHAAVAAGRLDRLDSQIVRALFRTEEAAPVATYWHWAYLMSVSSFVDFDFRKFIQSKYDDLASFGPRELATADEDRIFQVGTAFVEFQIKMRYAHLRYSAPLSGAFGGAYGFSLDDEFVFMQAVERQIHWRPGSPFEYDYFSDDLLDILQDLQFGNLRPRFAGLLSGKQQELLKPLGIDCYCRTEQVSYHDHYSEPSNVAELIDYWLNQQGKSLRYKDLQLQLDEMLGAENGVLPQPLYDFAAMREEARLYQSNALRKYTQGYQIISNPHAGSRRMPGEVRATEPKEANLFLRFLIWLGLASGQGDAALGNRGDFGRVAFSAGDGFRSAPM